MLYAIITGFLMRADGWGTKDPFWIPVAEFFNAITCALLFALLTSFYAPPLVALTAVLAFWLIRSPDFESWMDWLQMLWRGFWPSFIGFTLISLVAFEHPHYGLLSVPFSALYMLTYAGGYKWLPESILGFNRHVWIEHISGWIFAIFILGIL